MKSATTESILLTIARVLNVWRQAWLGLIAGSLTLLAGQSRPTVRQERWFEQSVAKTATRTAPDLRLVLNMERMTRSPHFRSYWVQRNVADLRQYYAGISDLQSAAQEVREERVLLRVCPVVD